MNDNKQKKNRSQQEWIALKQEFDEISPPIPAAKFFKIKGINPNSGRREFGKLKKLNIVGGDQTVNKPVKKLPSKVIKKGDQSSDQKSDHQNDQSSDHLKNVSKSATKNKNPQTNVIEIGDQKSVRQEWLTTPQQFKRKDSASDKQSQNRGLFPRGHQHNLKHGLYMKAVHSDVDLQKTVEDSILGHVSELVKLEEIRFLQMTRLMNENINHIKNLPDSQLPVDENGKTKNRLDLVSTIMWGSNSGLVNCFSSLTQAHLNALKVETDTSIKQSQFEIKAQDRELLKQLVIDRLHNDKTALETVRSIECHGLKPPALLVQEALKEISLIAPEIDDSGISDDELDIIANAYQSEMERRGAVMEDRESSLIQLFNDAKEKVENSYMVDEDDFDDWDGE